jgi:hypothetical protein
MDAHCIRAVSPRKTRMIRFAIVRFLSTFIALLNLSRSAFSLQCPKNAELELSAPRSLSTWNAELQLGSAAYP